MQNRIHVNVNQQEVEYKGLFFPFKIVKATLKSTLPEASFLKWCIHRTFNPNTGKIERKYAWDNILQHFADTGILTDILDNIIKAEELYNFET